MAKPTMDDSAYYVYVLFRHDTAEPFYVGKGKGRRWEQHQSLPKSDGNRHKKSIIQLARAAGKSVPVVFVGEGLTEPQAFDVERAFIKAIGRRANGGPLVNMTDGGEGASGVECSAETREKRRVNSTGRKFGPKTPEQRARLSAAKMGVPNTARLGHVVTEETRAKISASKKGVKIPALAGHAVTEDTRQKLRAASTGKSLSAETRAKLSDAGKRHEFTPEFISAFVERNRVRMLAGIAQKHALRSALRKKERN